jgi:hypothetical protein
MLEQVIFEKYNLVYIMMYVNNMYIDVCSTALVGLKNIFYVSNKNIILEF